MSYLYAFKTDSASLAGGKMFGVQDRVLIRISKAAPGLKSVPQLGSNLEVFGSLQPFRGPTNPHEFAWGLALQAQMQTSALLEVHSGYDLYMLGPPQRTIWSQIFEIASIAHAWIATQLDSAVRDVPTRGFIKAVVLGDRGEMERETLDDFTVAGVAHILAVSGFNVAIVGIVIAQLLRIFGIFWHRPRTIITMIAVFAYAAIVGWQPSVVRALFMIELYLLALLFERKPDSLNIIASAALVELVIRPSDLFDVSFQLSYAAVLGLILIAPQIRRLLGISSEDSQPHRTSIDRLMQNRSARRFAEAAALSLGATIASYPVIAAHFYRISIVGIFANLPAIPLSALITALGFLLIPLTALSSFLGHIYGDAATYLTNVLLLITRLSAHLPQASRPAAAPTWIYLAFFGCALTYSLRASTRKQFLGRVVMAAVCYVVLGLLHVPFSDSALVPNEGKLQVLFFDVGQGDCVYIRTPSGSSYLVDFGSMASSGTARVEQSTLPFLRAENSTNVMAGFISHMHSDHYGGAPSLLDHASVAQLFTSGERVHEPLAKSLEHDANIQHTSLHVLSVGNTIRLDTSTEIPVTLYTLHPTRFEIAGMRTNYGLNTNNGSLAFKLVYGRTSFLFLGDIATSDERGMVMSYGGNTNGAPNFLASDVVKVAHHGSLTNSCKELVQCSHPRFAVISVGASNRYGHPAPAVIKRWMGSGANVRQTNRDGAILFASDGTRVEEINWK
ncbi:MAG: DNA internalization-related competence protein ComEC/Rec2 [Bacteroidota bacterium]|nr:DNA internalization-related competence protein ComEC/Rec2 [Bacteroidota bacterium]MDP4232400.1 DNA internalization-related competence protein ComEC/Rec2 [Bacteroidota bacterium]MDP4288271.1 DNA internalization-related competence protein ComEC/Rec2 [Bacteroidota bacterium]